MNVGDLYHVGIVTDDFDATRAMLTDVFGYAWADETGGPQTVCLLGVDTTVDLRLTYSRSTPRLELVRTVPGTVWEPAAGSGIHHIGYWTDDVLAAGAELERHGYAAEAIGRHDDLVMWAYYGGPVGPRIEVVSRLLQPAMEQYWA